MVEGADLERLCGVTHRGFESLPLSHTNTYYFIYPKLFHCILGTYYIGQGIFMKKLSLLLLATFVLFSLSACDSSSLTPKGPVKKKYYTGGGLQSEFIPSDKTGHNGVLKQYGYNGKMTSKVTMQNGVKNGLETWYDPNNRAIRQVPFENGRKHGIMKELYPNGQTMAAIPFQNGMRQGTARLYNKDGSVFRTVEFRNGKMLN